ncbi:MAG: prepilin-type N-terminal cleavage/methylation domain-containing protein [Candidatus Marinimicrobia bacterium]|jgi:prepilin-type N-terminal cleavage/methylation domain-containing protein|nr:prepilin-type N-terminal cleavage/methylation domain-containing protein [Candidatus Neomarinimicrobiota bacterium]
MKNKNTDIKLQAGFTLMELLISLVISSVMFSGICFVVAESSRLHAYEDVKLDSKVFANYVLDDIEGTIVKGSNVSISAGTYTGIDEITIALTDGNIVYGSHSEYGVSKDDNKIYNYDNTYDNGKAKYSITEMRCYKPTSDSYNPSNPASLNILNSSFVLELKIGLFDPAGDELESYLVDRYVFNPYIYSTTS